MDARHIVDTRVAKFFGSHVAQHWRKVAMRRIAMPSVAFLARVSYFDLLFFIQLIFKYNGMTLELRSFGCWFDSRWLLLRWVTVCGQV